jgi:hypothetical protein
MRNGKHLHKGTLVPGDPSDVGRCQDDHPKVRSCPAGGADIGSYVGDQAAHPALSVRQFDGQAGTYNVTYAPPA